ncbi:MAG: hypothetical protein M1820_005461 [Bogoriella megaspora]|nr:MAG: hypothetical protein M1820_005461 [Bogoriella megaspora]
MNPMVYIPLPENQTVISLPIDSYMTWVANCIYSQIYEPARQEATVEYQGHTERFTSALENLRALRRRLTRSQRSNLAQAYPQDQTSELEWQALEDGEREYAEDFQKAISYELDSNVAAIMVPTLCKRFAYLMGRVSRHDMVVVEYFWWSEASGCSMQDVLWSLLRRAMMMYCHYPGGVIPAIREVNAECEREEERAWHRRAVLAEMEDATEEIDRLLGT